jgi:hypothetical protein
MSSLAQMLDALDELGPEGIARFQESLDPDWIEAALAATGKASIRRRKLPAEQAVWLVLGMSLFADRSITDVVDHLDLVLPGVDSLAPSSVPEARYRLGAEPMEWLFHKVADTYANSPGLPGYHGLSLFAVDGSSTRVQDSDDNFEHFGKPAGRGGANDAGYPQARIAVLMNLETRLLADAAFGPYSTSEQQLAQKLWSTIVDNSITILDRGFINYAVFASLIESGDNKHLLVRMRSDLKYDVVDILSDGSVLATLRPTPKVRRSNPDIRKEIMVRVIDYKHPGGQPSRLFTTLLDPKACPAQELIDLYHERWEIELGYGEIKTHMLERKECLRSKKPAGVEQELWGLLLVYNLVRREMLLAAQAHDLPPRRISFHSSLMWIRNFWLTAWRSSPGAIPKHLGAFRSTLDVLILPPRRSERRYPRHVKIKMSNYKRNRGHRNQGKQHP